MFRRRSSSKKSVQGTEGGREEPTGEDDEAPGPEAVLASLLAAAVPPELEVSGPAVERPAELAQDLLPSLARLAEWSLLWVLGALGASYSWVLLLATLHLAKTGLRDRARERAAIASQADSGGRRERDLLRSLGPDLLPSWVQFPDTDRAEWVNVILAKLWPHMGGLVDQLAVTFAGPKIQELMARLSLRGLDLVALSGFRLQQVVLGREPARVLGIRAYSTNTARDEVVMDVEVMYAGDMRAKFSVQGLDCEVNQVTFRATARLVLSPLLAELPVIGGLQFYFLTVPTFDFNLGGLAMAGELPGVSGIIRSVLDAVIRRGFVWPNRFSAHLPLASVERARARAFPMAAPQGVLCVGVREGRDLVKKDKHLIGGKSDPYVVLSVGESCVSFKDRYIDSDCNPVWNYEAAFPLEETAGLRLGIEVFDFDAGSEDDFLGRSSVEVTHCVARPADSPLEEWAALEDTKHGAVHLSALWRPVRARAADSGEAVLSIHVDSCRRLQGRAGSLPYPRVEVKVGSGEALRRQKVLPSEGLSCFQTKPRGPGEDPVYQEGRYIVSRQPDTDSVLLQVVEQRTGAILGRATLRVAYLAEQPGRTFHRMDWPLEGALHPEATITLSAALHYF